MVESEEDNEYQTSSDEEEVEVNTRTIAVKCNLIVNGEEVKTIIDSGAATSIITNSLRRKLGLKILRPSNTVFTMADGGRTPSLGKTEIILEIEDEEIPIEVQVIDSRADDLLLGNRAFRNLKAIIDYDKKIWFVRYNHKRLEIPIYYTEEEEKENVTSINCETFSLIENPVIYLAEMSNEEKEEVKKDLKIGEVTEEQKRIIEELIEKYRSVIAFSKTKLRTTSKVKHRINTGDHPPIASKPYTVRGNKAKVIEKEVVKMLEDGIIRKIESPWASPVVIVTKKSGNPRFCVDYRKINSATIIDAHPLPRIDELLEKFRTGRWFSSLDLASGYWQVEMDERDIEKTTFTCHIGLFAFNVMPFGLRNAPPTFQRLMNEVMGEYLNDFVVVYIDDIMVYSRTFEKHIEHLKKVFRKLQEANLMVKFRKCKFCEQNIEFLGHIVGRDGLQVDPKKIEKMRNLPPPTNITELRSAIGLFTYYRRFIEWFSKYTKPMTELLKKNKKFEWTEECQKAFDELKQMMTEAPILGYLDEEKEFILMTDASGKGLGAVLSQEDDEGREIVIAYASKKLNNAEKNYPITEQECLAIKWAIDHFHKYLADKPFKVITDHSALKTLMTTQNLTGRRARWVMKLTSYDFIIEHRAGKSNRNADALSRLV